MVETHMCGLVHMLKGPEVSSSEVGAYARENTSFFSM